MFIDAIGTQHNPATDARIISLVPSITELLFDMGLGGNLVGRTAFCVHPKEQVKQVKSIGGTKQVNLEKVKKLKATHLIVNIDENPKELVEELSKLIPHIVVTHPNKPADNIDLFSLIGNIFDRKGEAARLISELQAAQTQAQLSAMELDEKKVLYFIWKEPWMTIAPETYISQSLKIANMITYPQESDIRYPEIDLETGILDQVDAVLFSSEPFLFKSEHLKEFAQTYKVPADKLHIIDGEMTSWYGSRAIQGLRYLSDFAKGL
ncbi:Periplasmic binding protein [Candidatus Terasakiella magnetica]|uniref:Periplasmic binding protein n=1 Tax=Candidatus Terasakiella magnetica TaxID=1867952 RepID=A0A1C3RK22_9PROT|nr:helical backbone metal receptor [Candidatus Terasakiella magnetica]SCA57616.1 Periplasmic binding protein [Candidatus Terasakiella magnetica]